MYFKINIIKEKCKFYRFKNVGKVNVELFVISFLKNDLIDLHLLVLL